MSNVNNEMQYVFLRKMQFFGPIILLVAAVVIYWALADHEMRNVYAGVVAFMSIPDYFLFKLMADNLENS